MKYLFLPLFVLSICSHSLGQLPKCVKEKCDSILMGELGEKMYESCIEFEGYKVTTRLAEFVDDPCEAQSSHRYTVNYKFSFPSEEKASFTLGFVCHGYQGKMTVQSKYFYRYNQSDLPEGFKKKGLNIIDYQKIAKKASKEMAKNAPNKEFRRWEGGVLVLAQDKIYWAFSRREPYHDPSGFGDEAMIVSRVWVNPYTGKIIGSEVRRE